MWVTILGALMLFGAAASLIVLIKGLVVTNLSDLVPWGLWISLDLFSIAVSAGAFLFCALVYLLGLKQYQPMARTATFVGLIGYTMAMLSLFLDIGRPDRFYYGFLYWNTHSVLWEVTMCVGLYFTVLVIETMPIIGGADIFKQKWPHLSKRMLKTHQFAPYLAVAGLGLSLLHQSSLGATYGVLIARPIWFRPGLAVLFIISAVAGGVALTTLGTVIAGP
jgi:Ni/Fe-hydrogenase subunit HybB-like protein